VGLGRPDSLLAVLTSGDLFSRSTGPNTQRHSRLVTHETSREGGGLNVAQRTEGLQALGASWHPDGSAWLERRP
jgi:hypothetical protein